ncbi:MAG: type VI secretion system contractile sheath large subunit [Deltaproteobacteria bacterium]|nr:type VI secretion system contractile sheath large subunit [Deltaproteobacteria bacterium]
MSDAKVRIRMAAAVSRAPAGARFVLSSDSWAERFKAAFASLSVEVTDRIGAGPKRRFDLSPKALSELSLGGVIKGDATLGKLAEHAKKSPNAEAWLRDLEAIAGAGALVDACRNALSPTPVTAPEAAPAAAPAEGDAVERMFDKAEVAKPTGKAAIDSFVKAMRPGTGGSTPVAPANAARAARDVLERAVFETAKDVLADPTVAKLESSWRALRWIVENAPASAGLAIEILDVTPDNALSALEALPPADDFEDPDLFVLADPIAIDVAKVAAYAEAQSAPAIVSIDAARAALDPDTLLARLTVKDAETVTDEARAWHTGRVSEDTRWLTIAYGEVVVHQEGTGAFERSVFASPAYGLVAMLGASYAATGSFARILGQSGQIAARGTHTIKAQDIAVPTRHFTSIRAQTDLATMGILAIGSPRNSERLALSGAPTHRASRDAVPLPAQLWTGRIVRFARWVRAQLPAGSGSDEAREIFEQAGGVFLFPGTGKAAKVTAEIREKDGKRELLVGARMDGTLAMIPLDIEFALPL